MYLCSQSVETIFLEWISVLKSSYIFYQGTYKYDVLYNFFPKEGKP